MSTKLNGYYMTMEFPEWGLEKDYIEDHDIMDWIEENRKEGRQLCGFLPGSNTCAIFFVGD